MSIAYAANGVQGAGGGFTALIPLLIMFVIFYFLLIRPQQKKVKEHREMVENLKKGDKIVTSGGIHGRITSLDDTTLTIEIADKVRVKLNRGNIATIIPATGAQVSSEKEKDKAEQPEKNEQK